MLLGVNTIVLAVLFLKGTLISVGPCIISLLACMIMTCINMFIHLRGLMRRKNSSKI